MHRIFTPLLLSLAIVAACAPVARAPQTPTGPAAAASAAPTGDGRVAISRSQSQLSISGDDSIVTQRHLRRLPDRYDEVLTLDDGMIEYLKYPSGRSGEDADGRVTIQRLLQTETYQQLGLPELPPGYKVGRNRNGEFDYTIVDGAEVRCVLMSQFFGVAMPGGGRTQELRLTRCRAPGAPRFAALEADVLEMIGRIAFDGGAINRAKEAAPRQP